VRSVIWRGIELAEFRAVDVRIIGTALTGILNWAYVWYSPSGDENGRHDSHQRCGRAAFTGSAECCIRCNSSHFEGGAEGMPFGHDEQPGTGCPGPLGGQVRLDDRGDRKLASSSAACR